MKDGNFIFQTNKNAAVFPSSVNNGRIWLQQLQFCCIKWKWTTTIATMQQGLLVQIIRNLKTVQQFQKCSVKKREIQYNIILFLTRKRRSEKHEWVDYGSSHSLVCCLGSFSAIWSIGMAAAMTATVAILLHALVHTLIFFYYYSIESSFIVWQNFYEWSFAIFIAVRVQLRLLLGLRWLFKNVPRAIAILSLNWYNNLNGLPNVWLCQHNHMPILLTNSVSQKTNLKNILKMPME